MHHQALFHFEKVALDKKKSEVFKCQQLANTPKYSFSKIICLIDVEMHQMKRNQTKRNPVMDYNKRKSSIIE